MNNVVANGVKHQITHRMQFQLAHDIRAVGLGRLNTQSKSNSHFFGALAFRKKLHDFALARGQTIAGLGSGRLNAGRAILEVSLQHHSGHFRGEVGLVTSQSLDRRDQISSSVGFQQEPARASVQNFTYDLV